ncbi:MAG: ATP-binding protein [Desulfacinum sp.]|nr:ATP-binding protein [Desulfacinum sp.]
MKICLCGKGGSGKTTIVTLMADAFGKHGKSVTVLDSDESNSGLFWMLGFEKAPLPLMESLGGKRKVQEKMMARFSRGQGEPEMAIWEGGALSMASLPSQYVVQREGLALITVGKIYQALERCACPMGVVAREFLKKVELGPDEVLLVDMDAGIEHFGRGIEASVDAVVCVVEPSLESVSLAHKMKELTGSVGAAFQGAVLNKVTSLAQEASLSEKLQSLNVPILGTIYHHEQIVASCLEGKALDAGQAALEMERIVRTHFLGDPP